MTTKETTLAERETALAEREIAAMSAADYSAPTLECDMIMKGGITSGVVYPLTVCKLAEKYRLRGIGGTSAGAIAAALAAAAEYRRSHDQADPSAGFRMLATLPMEIAEKLKGLFQPHPDARGIFAVLNAQIDPKHQGLGRLARVIWAIIKGQALWFLGGLLLVLVPAVLLLGLGEAPSDVGQWVGLVLAVLLALAIGVLAAVVGLVLSALKILPTRDFGLTDGATYDATPALTEWLADWIDEVAGLDGDRCLTLGDLWGQAAVDAWRSADPKEPVGRLKRMREIDVEMMTTDLTIRRPFRIPFGDQKLFFDRDEMLHLFPERVVETMCVAESDHLNPKTGKKLWFFPGPGRRDPEARPGPESLPLVVMARLSLSFPFLISAVPLYAVDFNGDQKVVRHLFSDGGISSNFPMHFFDSLLPRRPTFGVNLAPPHPTHPDQMVWRAEPTEGGWIPRALPFHTVPGFGGALRETIQNWADYRQITQRGYADRVVEIRLSSTEGGMNLNMDPKTIMALVARGAQAGDEFLTFNWRAHRLMRYRIALGRLNDSLEGLRFAFGEGEYADLVTGYGDEPGKSYLGGEAWRVKELAATDKLLKAIDSWEESDWIALSVSVPSPAPVIRLAPE